MMTKDFNSKNQLKTLIYNPRFRVIRNVGIFIHLYRIEIRKTFAKAKEWVGALFASVAIEYMKANPAFRE